MRDWWGRGCLSCNRASRFAWAFVPFVAFTLENIFTCRQRTPSVSISASANCRNNSNSTTWARAVQPLHSGTVCHSLSPACPPPPSIGIRLQHELGYRANKSTCSNSPKVIDEVARQIYDVKLWIVSHVASFFPASNVAPLAPATPASVLFKPSCSDL